MIQWWRQRQCVALTVKHVNESRKQIKTRVQLPTSPPISSVNNNKNMKTPAKKLEQVRRWRANNLERAREISRNSRNRNPEKARERARLWHVNNRERHLAYMARRRKENSRAVLSSKLKAAFGISLEQYEAIASKQNHCCAICGTPQVELRRKMAVDHDHETGKVRGLLCNNCNVGLGNFRDSEQLLVKAQKYIHEHKHISSPSAPACRPE